MLTRHPYSKSQRRLEHHNPAKGNQYEADNQGRMSAGIVPSTGMSRSPGTDQLKPPHEIRRSLGFHMTCISHVVAPDADVYSPPIRHDPPSGEQQHGGGAHESPPATAHRTPSHGCRWVRPAPVERTGQHHAFNPDIDHPTFGEARP